MIESINDLSTAGMPFGSPRSMNAVELGDSLAQLVWENFSDFIAEGDASELLGAMGIQEPEETLDARMAEEMLIFLMWAHTRGVQLAFLGRDGEELVKNALDSMHRAVFDDMVQNGTPASEIPLFEQRVSARYADYYSAAEVSDTRLGATAFRNVTGTVPTDADRIRTCAQRAVSVANPLKDFLEDISLVP
jgi:hypothetical protein